MTEQLEPNGNGKQMEMRYQGGSDAVYGLGLIGAWIFYFSRVHNFADGVKAFFKGLFWPVFLVRAMLEFFEKKDD